MFDKLLLVLLLILLPLGIILSRQFSDKDGNNSVKASDINLEKLEQLITQVSEQASGQNKPANQPEINITGVLYASDSGVLRVAGIAPSDKVSLWIFVNEMDKGVIVPEVDNAAADRAVFGKIPDVRALKPNAGGGFTFEHPIKDGFDGKIEVLVLQQDSRENILFDIGNNKQITLE